jgi:hypothetical protein
MLAGNRLQGSTPATETSGKTKMPINYDELMQATSTGNEAS